jgi:ATP-dependent protease ClpP protease subunit
MTANINNQGQGALSGKNCYLHYHGPIEAETVGIFRNVTLNVLAGNPSAINYIFSSNGGDVSSGISLYHFISGLSVPTHMYAFGNVDSIAVVVFLAAQFRHAVNECRFLIHRPSLKTPVFDAGPYVFSDYAQTLRNDAETYIDIFQKRTRDAERHVDVRKAMAEDALIITAPEAVSCGIIHDIISPIEMFSPENINISIPLYSVKP